MQTLPLTSSLIWFLIALGALGWLLFLIRLWQGNSAARVSEEKFARAFDASPNSILLTSMPDGRILESNEGFTRITGYTREEARGRSTMELDLWVNLEDRARIYEELAEKGRVFEAPIGIKARGSSTHRSCLLTGEVIQVDGQPTLFTVVRDITELENKNAELEAKNAELERFGYTVSHDLKSPLVTIRGFLGLLIQDAEAGDMERMRADAERIRDATETMQKFLDEILTLSRVGLVANVPEAVSLAEVASLAIGHLAAEIAESGAAVEVSPELPVVVGDKIRLLQVYQNLIANAIKFLGDAETPRVEVGVRQEGEVNVFFVKDNGIGIDKRYHEQIFGVFDRLNVEVPGSGVGLSLVKRIIEAHGGRIWVESEGEGYGSVFCFTLGK